MYTRACTHTCVCLYNYLRYCSGTSQNLVGRHQHSINTALVLLKPKYLGPQNGCLSMTSQTIEMEMGEG